MSLTKVMQPMITPLNSMVIVNTANGYGSTNTKIRRFTTIVTNTGSAITYADSAGNGGSFTINEDGIYCISYSDNASSSFVLGLSLNSAQLTTNIQNITTANRLSVAEAWNGNASGFCSWCGILSATDVIRAHTDGIAGGTAAITTLTITQILKF